MYLWVPMGFFDMFFVVVLRFLLRLLIPILFLLLLAVSILRSWDVRLSSSSVVGVGAVLSLLSSSVPSSFVRLGYCLWFVPTRGTGFPAIIEFGVRHAGFFRCV